MANPFATLFAGGGFMDAISTIIPTLIGMALLGVVIWLLLNFKRYNVDVEIYSPRAGKSMKMFKDRGGFIKVKGKGTQFKLMKQKAIIPGINLEHIMSAGRKNYLKLMELDKGELIPLNVYVDKTNFKLLPEEADITEYRNQRFMKNQAQWEKQTLMEKLVPVLTIAVPAVLVIVLMYVVLKDLGEIANTLSAVAKNIAAACGGGAPI